VSRWYAAAVKLLALPAAAAKFVSAGGRDVRFDGELVAGERVQLVDERGDEVGLGVCDPDNALVRVLAVPSDGFAQIDAALLGWRVERALAWRRALGLVGADRAYRLVHGAGDGLPGFTCDVLGRAAVVYAYGAGLLALARSLAESIAGFARLDGAVVKLRVRGDGDGTIDRDVIGRVDERAVVGEHELAFEVHPLGAINTGLFTDMREQRRGLARFAAGKRVLNLFSYTGALSVACARAGAASVVSVDTSDGVHAWARGNFERNGVTGRFEAGDAVRFLARADRDRERYDLILIDPPTFSTARGAPWSADRDYPELIAKAARVLDDGGVLWLAANTHAPRAELAKLAHAGARDAGRAVAIVEQAGLPPEYPTLAAQPRDRYLQICVVRIV
jgi:23S rRNA (cytosine1962-C5)-methyltransferase